MRYFILLLFTGCLQPLFTLPENRPKEPVKIVFLDIGQGDATLILQGNSAALVDAGPPESGLLDTLKRRGIDSLDWVLVTHPHLDHYGGLSTVLQKISLGYLFLPQDSSADSAWSGLLNLASQRGILSRRLQRGDTLPLRFPLQGEVLWPSRRIPMTENNSSIALYLHMEKSSVFFTGDLEKEAEHALGTLGRLPKINILQVGHHGSRTSSSLSFLGKILPEYAVISLSRGNSFAHPHSEALASLDAVLDDSGKILRTDQLGSISFRLYGDAVERIFP